MDVVCFIILASLRISLVMVPIAMTVARMNHRK